MKKSETEKKLSENLSSLDLSYLESNLNNLKLIWDNYVEPMIENTMFLNQFFQNNNVKDLMTKFLRAIIDLKYSKFVSNNIGQCFISLCNEFFKSAGKYLYSIQSLNDNSKKDLDNSNKEYLDISLENSFASNTENLNDNNKEDLNTNVLSELIRK